MRRLDNPGNYPTPLGASKRVDIVRGPASPIHGPSKIGGYLNFNPKSARIEETGEFIADATGTVGVDVGSWNRRVLSAEVGGPGRLGGQAFGYWLYGMREDSGSYYRNSGIEQTVVQASFDLDVGAVQFQFGGMVHDFTGNQIAGWNRLTQNLVDRGLYVTGSPRPLDADGDGYISHQEFDIDGDGFTDFSPFAAGLAPGAPGGLRPDEPFEGACTIGTTLVFGCRADLLGLTSSGTTTLTGDKVLVGPDDVLSNEVITLYFDTIVVVGNWEWRNQAFFETYDNLNENDYGFSQFHDSWVFEDKLVVANEFVRGDARIAVQVSPSVRLTEFDHGDDYTNEYFDRRDLTLPSSSLAKRLLATRIDDDYTEYYIGRTVNVGIAALVDMEWRRVNVLAGLRHDTVDMKSRQPVEKLLLPSSNNFCLDLSCVVADAEDRVDGVSWTVSLSYRAGAGLIPYVTASRQATVIAGQGAEIATASIADGQAFDDSTLLEVGVKGSLLGDALYFAVAAYEQERTDYSAQQTVTNQASRTRGLEFELRWAVSERLLMTLGYSNIEVVNLNTLEAGQRFSFIGADDVPGIPPEAIYGGSLGGSVVRSGSKGARRAGIPEKVRTATATYDFGGGLAASAGVVDVAATPSGYSGSVVLPGYTLVNAGLVFEAGNWVVSATAKNLTDERYFRANFPNLFGGVIVLPELPRHFAARVQYRW